MKDVILQGDCLEELKKLPDNSVDAVVTDPPYGLSKEPKIREVLEKWLSGEEYKHGSKGFMNAEWDSFVPGPAVWKEVHRVLKPGGHLLCFAGTRTQDLMTISLRIAGFEIRDVIEHLYFSGMPHALDISKQFDKQAGVKGEVIGTYHYKRKGTGTWDQNVKGGIYAAQDRIVEIHAPATEEAKKWAGWRTGLAPAHEPIILARKKLEINVCYTVRKYGTGGLNIDACRIGSEDIKTRAKEKGQSFTSIGEGQGFNGCPESIHKGRFPANCVTLEPDQFYSKYFNITPAELSKKASKKDKNSDWKGDPINVPNTHTTPKSTLLMSWLCRLICPPGGIVLDPFAGSGSTLVAAKREGFHYIGIELSPEYVEIIKARLGEDEAA